MVGWAIKQAQIATTRALHRMMLKRIDMNIEAVERMEGSDWSKQLMIDSFNILRKDLDSRFWEVEDKLPLL